MLIVVKMTPAAKAEACSGACEHGHVATVVVVVFLVVVGLLTVVVVGAVAVTIRLMGDD